jgi:hypothetical protein
MHNAQFTNKDWQSKKNNGDRVGRWAIHENNAESGIAGVKRNIIECE